MRLEVEARGEKQAARLLERLARRADGRLVLLSLLDTILDAQRARYRGEGARWKKLAASTIRKDREQGRDPRPMIQTGRLMDSLTRRGDRDMVLRVREGQLFVGTSVFYARFHHKGKGGMPKRTVAGFTRVQRAKVIDELRELLLED